MKVQKLQLNIVIIWLIGWFVGVGFFLPYSIKSKTFSSLRIVGPFSRYNVNNEADTYSSPEGGSVVFLKVRGDQIYTFTKYNKRWVLWIFEYLKIYHKSVHILYEQVDFGNDDTVCWEI